ncbi:MAG: hypothetical protein WBQ76_15810, partial [Candidatus Korobacteraceae bacterium]
MAVFLLICVASVLFFVGFLVKCTRSHRTSRRAPVIRKISTTEALDSAAGRRTLIHLEQQMAEFLSSQGRSVAALLLAVGLVATSTQMKAQSSAAPASPTIAADEQVSPAVQKQLDAMQKRIEQLEAELSARSPQGTALTSKATAPIHVIGDQTAPASAAAPAESASAQQTAAPGKPAKPAPFSFADFSWLNGNSRIKDVPLDTKFFTPEIRADVD